MQKDAIAPGSRVLIIDDLIATGGSAKAAGELVAKLGGKTVEYIFLVSIPFLQGTEKLDAPAYRYVDLLEFWVLMLDEHDAVLVRALRATLGNAD